MGTRFPAMKINKTSRKHNGGFTLLELLGALAVIGILSVLSVPAIRSSIRDSKFNATMKQVETVETAVSALAKKQGGPGYPPLTEGAATTAFTYTGTLGAATAPVIAKAAVLDNVFLAEGLISKPLDIRIGSSTMVGTTELLWSPTSNAYYTAGDVVPSRDYSSGTRVECQLSTTTAPSSAAGTNFWLGRETTSTGNLPANARVVSLVIPNVTGTDAKELADRYNNNSAASATALNDYGRAVYAAPNATTGLTTVYIYITHF